AARVDCFVGRDQDELADSRPRGTARYSKRSHHVVPNSFDHVPFQHRDVFVRGRVEYQLRPVNVEDVLQPVGVGNAGQHRDHIDFRIALRDFQMDEVQGALGPLEQHQLGRTEPGELPGQLRTDGAAGAGYQNHLAFNVRLDGLEIEVHR